jgi:catechol-2,3-dioxygenase
VSIEHGGHSSKGAVEAPVRPAKLAHIVLRTTQYAEMVDWYSTVLGATISFEVPNTLCFLTYDDEHHRVAIGTIPGLSERPERAVGLDHVAFTYGSLGDLIHTYERLADLGIAPFWTINHGPTMSFYYRDPDQNQVELQVDNFTTAEEVDHYLATEFPKNPIGVEFDADDLARRFHSGVSETELRRRPDIGDRVLGAPLQ